MIPILYEKTEMAFTSNGIGRLADCIRCIVTEERNGIYECEFDYPVTGVLFSEIEEGRIIACTHDEQGDIQPFDIYGRSEPINGVVTFYAHHISYRQNEITVKAFTAGSCAEAFTKIVPNSVPSNPFTYWTDKSVTASYNSEVPRNVKGMLGGEENSILDVFGTGEYEYDKFTVKFHLHRGQDTNVSIRYGKNLIDFTNQYDTSDVYTAVVPFWYGDVYDQSAKRLVLLPEVVIRSGHTVPSGREVVVPMDLSDSFDDEPRVSDLRNLATSRLNSSNGWMPNQTVTVDFVQLWQTEEYADFAPLQRLRLCDTCGVFVPMYNMALRAKVIKVEYNVLLDRYDRMELGDKPTTYTAVMEKIYNSKVAGVYQGFQAVRVDIANALMAAAHDASGKADAAAEEAKAYADSSVSNLKDDLETQIDGKIETWAQVVDPQTEWDDKTAHDGDLWLYTGLVNKSVGGQEIRPQGVYIFTLLSEANTLMNENSIDLTNQNDLVLEINDRGVWEPYASTSDNLFDLADGKTAIFYGSPTGSYSGVSNGDYLVDSSTGMTYRYNNGAWVKQTDYKTYADTQIADATEMIRGGMGGYVVTTVNAAGQPIELLITDNLDLTRAVNVWRWNSGGLAHSSNGYDGPFNDVAITADGKINATMIKTGALNANLITAGAISDSSGKNTWNLTSGNLTTNNGVVGGFDISSDGIIKNRDVTSTNKHQLRINSSLSYSNNMSVRVASLAARYGRAISLVSSGTLEFLFSSSVTSGSGGSFDDLPSMFYVTPIKNTMTYYSDVPCLQMTDSSSGSLGSTVAELYQGSGGVEYPLMIRRSTYITGNLKCTSLTVVGAKPREVKTKNYAERLLYAYETPTPYFGDIGEAQLDEDGICYVDVDDIFSETIANVEYQVFLQKEGQGDCWIEDKQKRYFVIKGTPNLKVAWELKAAQRDYELTRLEQSTNNLEEYTYSDDDTSLLESYINEQEVLLYG